MAIEAAELQYVLSDTIILLTGKEESLYLGNQLHTFSRDLIIEHVTDISGLENIIRSDSAGRKRLITFCSDVIIPGRLLDVFPGPSYNFHPGPPSYPGNYVAGFALYEGARQFGATAHIMKSQVDKGNIIGTEIFDIPQYCEFEMLEIMTYQAMLRLFDILAPKLANLDNEPELMEAKWAGKKYSSKDLKAMFNAWATLNTSEKLRRTHAFGHYQIGNEFN